MTMKELQEAWARNRQRMERLRDDKATYSIELTRAEAALLIGGLSVEHDQSQDEENEPEFSPVFIQALAIKLFKAARLADTPDFDPDYYGKTFLIPELTDESHR